MKKILTTALFLLMSSQLTFAEIDKNYLFLASKLVENKQYDEALRAYRYYFIESKKESSLGGVRLSFCLGDWAKLGKVYPPAMNELISMSDERKKIILSGKGNSEVFQEYNAINRYIERDSETLATFIAVDKDFPEQAESYRFFARDLIIDAKQYDLAKKYIDPLYEFENLRFARESDLRFSRKSNNTFQAHSDARFEENVYKLIDLANQIGLKDDAAKIKRRFASYILESPLKK